VVVVEEQDMAVAEVQADIEHQLELLVVVVLPRVHCN
jgi:hypothetical protein